MLSPTLRMRAVDWALLAIFALEAPSFLFSQYRTNGVGVTEGVALAVLVYFVVRLIIRTPAKTAWLAGVLGLGAIWPACTCIGQFANMVDPLRKVGLTNLLAFRSSLVHAPSGWVPAELYTALLEALPFTCAATANLWRNGALQGQQQGGAAGRAVLALASAVPIVAVLCLSLSRSVFWSTVAFFFIASGLMAAYRVITLRTASLLVIAALGTLLLIMICETALYPGIFKAYAGGHTSQMRSTKGRISIWSRSMELVRDHPLWGVGSSNAGLFLLSSAEQEETTGFAGRAFSLPVQVLAEKGIVGFVLYVTFLLLLSREFHRSMRWAPAADVPLPSSATTGRKSKAVRFDEEKLQQRQESALKAMKCCFAAGLLAVLLRELTYSSLFEHSLTLAVTFALSALLCEQPSAAR